MRALAAAVAALVVVVLTGCTSNEREYIEAVREHGPAVYALATDEELVEMGEAACDVMDTQTPEEFIMNGIMYADLPDDFDWEAAGAIFGIASNTLCPEHKGWGLR